MIRAHKGYAVFALLVLFFLSLVLFLLPHTGLAQCASGATGEGGFVPLECFEGSAKLRGAYQEGNLAGLMNRAFVGAISIGAILAVLRLAWAGFRYMSSDLWSSKEQAKEIIRDTLLGLFLLLAIWLILYQINPQILSLQVRTQPIQPSATAPSSPLTPGPDPRIQPSDPFQRPNADPADPGAAS